jgi:glycosyltransferase involved in cell wall biosynthesis
MQEERDVSVVVPTHNRAALLAKTIDSLLGQCAEGIRYEIIVVDNNSKDNTREIAEAFCRRTPAVRYLFEPRQGVSHTRNTGLAAARAPVIAFIDDDVEAEPGWLAAMVRALAEHPEADCLGGRIKARWHQPPPRWLTHRHWGALALQGSKGPYVDASNASPCLMTANFVCRRAALEQVGGFSPAFMRDEDRELQLRLWAAGKRGLYVDDLVVTTDVPPERLTKEYHRQFNARVGASHARMRYLDRLDHHGHLVPQQTSRLTLLGTPAFIYRKLLRAAWLWFRSASRLDWDRAFFHEVRLRYFLGYITMRYREEHRRPLALPAEIQRVVRSRARTWLRRHVERVGV